MSEGDRGGVVCGIGGPSGSGKTTLSRALALQLHAAAFPLDVYYKDLSATPLEERHRQNFDAPESLDLSLMVEHLRALRHGRPVEQPVYDYRTHTRVAGRSARLEPRPFVIAEGILALHFAALLPLYALRVYCDAPHDVCLERRTRRDVHERGRTEASVHEQFVRLTRPMAERYVLPSEREADISVDGTLSLDWSVEAVLRALRDRGLLHRGGNAPG